MCPCENNCKITWLVPVSHPPCTHDHPRGNTSPEMEAKRQHRIILPTDSPPGTFTSGLFTSCSASWNLCSWSGDLLTVHLPIILVHYMFICWPYEYILFPVHQWYHEIPKSPFKGALALLSCFEFQWCFYLFYFALCDFALAFENEAPVCRCSKLMVLNL